MAFLSQASPLGSLLLPHAAFQEHAAHLAEWSAKLSSKGSERTCIRSGLTTFLPCTFTAHSDLVVDHWTSAVESSSPLDVLSLHAMWTPCGRLICYKIMSIISVGCDFTTKSGGIWQVALPFLPGPLWPPSQPHRRLLAGDEGHHWRRSVFFRSASALPPHTPGPYGTLRATNLCVPLVVHSPSDFMGAASIMASATPFYFWAMQKQLTVERTRRSRTQAIILSGRKWPTR